MLTRQFARHVSLIVLAFVTLSLAAPTAAASDDQRCFYVNGQLLICV